MGEKVREMRTKLNLAPKFSTFNPEDGDELSMDFHSMDEPLDVTLHAFVDGKLTTPCHGIHVQVAKYSEEMMKWADEKFPSPRYPYAESVVKAFRGN